MKQAEFGSLRKMTGLPDRPERIPFAALAALETAIFEFPCPVKVAGWTISIHIGSPYSVSCFCPYPFLQRCLSKQQLPCQGIKKRLNPRPDVDLRIRPATAFPASLYYISYTRAAAVFPTGLIFRMYYTV
jgi:hypothetical protein